MSELIQVALIKKILYDWANSDDCNGVKALAAIMDILSYDPYAEATNESTT